MDLRKQINLTLAEDCGWKGGGKKLENKEIIAYMGNYFLIFVNDKIQLLLMLYYNPISRLQYSSLLSNLGKTWASGRSILEASATFLYFMLPLGIKREWYVCMYA
jgi:hypothetical protein